MSIYVKIGKKILKNIDHYRPHVKVRDISCLNFAKMKEMGMEKVIFEKDNTLTKFGKTRFFNKHIRKAFVNSKKTFGKDNVIVVSSMSNDRFLNEFTQYDKELQEVKFLNADMVGEKPNNFLNIKDLLKKVHNYNLGDPSKVAMVGDKLLYDICLGNKNFMTSIYVNKFQNFYHKAEFSNKPLIKWEKTLQSEINKSGTKFH